jgi:hypothetical protein
MLAKQAKDYFLGKNGKRLNCYQSVIVVFKDIFDLKTQDIEEGLKFSGGRAPEGICGAVYAVKKIYERKRSSHFEKFSNKFIQQNGSIKCQEIRKLKKASCAECVEQAVEYLENTEEKL